MAYLRKLPSGKWQATVRLPSGKKASRSDVMKNVVAAWAREEESRIARGEWRDPRSGRMPYEEWRDRWLGARVVEQRTFTGDVSIIRNHLDPHWTGWRLAAISRLEVQAWVRRMQKAGSGASVIKRAYNLFSSMMLAALDEGMLNESPCRRIDLPRVMPKQPEWFTREQIDAIREHLPERHSIAVELMVWTGLRWGEMAGLQIQDVDFLRRRIIVRGSATQTGVRKEHPKSSKSRREVPVPVHVVEQLAPLTEGRGPEDRLFVTTRMFKKQYRPWSGPNWNARFGEAVAAAGAPPYSAHALRHTAASWLVQAGVPLYDVQALLGHESFATTQRYAHLRPGAHTSIEDAWARLSAHQRRTVAGLDG